MHSHIHTKSTILKQQWFWDLKRRQFSWIFQSQTHTIFMCAWGGLWNRITTSVCLNKAWFLWRGFSSIRFSYKILKHWKFLYSAVSLNDQWIPLSLNITNPFRIFFQEHSNHNNITTTTATMLSRRMAKIKERQLPVARENRLLKSIIPLPSCFSTMGNRRWNIKHKLGDWLTDWIMRWRCY